MPEHQELFRFHTGSIKRSRNTPDQTGAELFRFHTGSIKSYRENPNLHVTEISFDSILVRLKDAGRFRHGSGVFVFRFDTGSIKSTNDVTNESVRKQVSIPYWFD